MKISVFINLLLSKCFAVAVFILYIYVSIIIIIYIYLFALYCLRVISACMRYNLM